VVVRGVIRRARVLIIALGELAVRAALHENTVRRVARGVIRRARVLVVALRELAALKLLRMARETVTATVEKNAVLRANSHSFAAQI
jgi:hypothetical protein